MDGSCNIILFVFLWLITLSSIDLCICSASSEAQCITSERDALLTMKHYLSDPLNRLASWSPHGINCSHWDFVVCSNITGHILELHLTTPPPFEFKDEIMRHYGLVVRNFFGGLQIPDFLGSMTSLKYLNLSHAEFGGRIPLHFWNLSNLIYLDLSNNYFEGSIPHQIGSLSNLQYLDLGNNYLLNGSIPHQIRNLSNMIHLDLGGNDFSGSIPQPTGNLSNLFYLHLGGFNLSHEDDYGSYKSFENLQWFSSLSSFQSLSSLQYLELSYVNLSNAFDWLQVLHSLLSLRSLTHFLCHKQEEKKSLQFLHLASNNLSRKIPDCWMTWPYLTTVILENNNFNGILPTSMGSLLWLQMLYLRNNNVLRNFPTILKDKANLISLDLGDNQFSGVIPSWVGQSLSNLKVLVLRSNKFFSSIPSEICAMSSLQILDFA
ncbi:leucine-rich repeat receptor-like serine/threonine-protein kinase SKM1 [Prosopis cineraria]|uniref:leucine-rich repeat receptor-like serine/threonine-protein kinase SKM1 n=1 Tax=Prosopis cineraria TaxID=364024 RepID=UPI00241065E9|nr:leucine-rich repeat receptor-like serine/threonine-protein kinase SKM1 [Prosopis cineraria]